MTLLLATPSPRGQLNNFLTAAIRPILATFGPWNNVYGLRDDNLQIDVQISIDNEGLRFMQLPNANSESQLARQSTVMIEEITELSEDLLPAYAAYTSQQTAPPVVNDLDSLMPNLSAVMSDPVTPFPSSESDSVSLMGAPSLDTALITEATVDNQIPSNTMTAAEPSSAIVEVDSTAGFSTGIRCRGI